MTSGQPAENWKIGKVATNEITDSLLSVEEKGREKHAAFILRVRR